MTDDLIPFLTGVILLALLLWLSAKTEMGTKFPWNKR